MMEHEGIRKQLLYRPCWGTSTVRYEFLLAWRDTLTEMVLAERQYTT
jgi:hypothetical protein